VDLVVRAGLVQDLDLVGLVRVRVVGATTSLVLEELGAATDDDAAFARRTVDISAFAGQTVRIRIEAVSLDSTSIKVHPDGTGALKKTAHSPSASPAADGIPRFIWLPRMLERQ
jgi:hypothetical protein